MSDQNLPASNPQDMLIQFHRKRLEQFAQRKGITVTEARFLIADLNSRLCSDEVTAVIDMVVDVELHSSKQPNYVQGDTT